MSCCTAIDHCYPQNAPAAKTRPGTPCYCGRRTWPGAPRIRRLQRLAVGAVVQVLAAEHEGTRTVVERVREDGDYLYRTDGAPVYGRKLWERAELEVVR